MGFGGIFLILFLGSGAAGRTAWLAKSAWASTTRFNYNAPLARGFGSNTARSSLGAWGEILACKGCLIFKSSGLG
jgi:hypothetical protein